VTTSILSNLSSAHSKPTNLDDLDARELIYTRRSRLRALWTVWSVEVRVFSGALGKAEARLGRSISSARADRQRGVGASAAALAGLGRRAPRRSLTITLKSKTKQKHKG
jgi:hypothetical protein